MCGESTEKYFNIVGWILQVGTWLFLILYFVFQKPALIVICAIFYLIYLLMEFCSPTSSYLCNKSSTQGMYEKMKIYFQTPPMIKWTCECFHYETHNHVRISPQGIDKYTSKEKVVSYTGKSNMEYYSARDISGIFILNCDKNLLNTKAYIKLELKANIDFADPPTIRDYQIQKDYFINQNKYKDDYFDFQEKRLIPDMDEYNLVRIFDTEPKSVNFGLFFILTILTFVEFYKIYINYFCVYQKFIVKKIISTRYNLNLPMYTAKYQQYVPVINLINVTYNYQPSDYNYLNNDFKLDLPTREEVENANQNMNNNQYPPQNEYPTDRPLNMRDIQIDVHNQPNYQGNIPPQGNVPPPNYQGNVPPPNYQGNVPPPNYQENVPPPNYQGNVPLKPLDNQLESTERFNKEQIQFDDKRKNNENNDKDTVVSVDNK